MYEIDYKMLEQIILFICSGIGGMFFAYLNRWTDEIKDKTLTQYIFGDTRATVRAFMTLFAMCGGAMIDTGGNSILDAMSMSQIIMSGIGIGLLVPQTVDRKKIK